MPRADLSAVDFLERLHTRDSSAWGALVEEDLPQLLRAGRGMGFSADESRDLPQSAFVAMMEPIGKFERRSQLAARMPEAERAEKEVIDLSLFGSRPVHLHGRVLERRFSQEAWDPDTPCDVQKLCKVSASVPCHGRSPV